MTRTYFMGFSLIGIGVALAIFIPLDAKRIARIPPFVRWLCVILGVVSGIYGLSYSTVPSFATRITAVGRAYDCGEVRYGRDSHFRFRFEPEQGEPVNIETEIILPGWGTPDVFDGRTLRVVYLDDIRRSLKNEAIDIEILTGRDTGFHDSVDARPTGKWLGIPLGAALASFGIFVLKSKKDDAISAVSDGDTPST